MVKTRLAQAFQLRPSPVSISAFGRHNGASVLVGHVEVAIMCPASDIDETNSLVPGGVGVVAQKARPCGRLDPRCLHTSQRLAGNALLPSTATASSAAVSAESAFEALSGHDVVVGPA